MSKNYLGHIDSRNTKYQGFIQNGIRNGFGILIDDILLFVLALWKNDQISGPCYIAFPKRQIFYGKIQQGKPVGVGCFIPNQQYSLYIRFNSEGIAQRIAIKFVNQLVAYEAIIQEHFKQKSIKIIKGKDCNSKEQVYKQIEKILGKQLKESEKYCDTFIKQHFAFEDKLIQIIKTSRGFTFVGFKQSTLGIQINGNNVQAVGLFSNAPRQLLMGKKYKNNHKNEIIIEQGIFPEDTIKYSQQRPIQVTKILQQYFKKSTTFQNKFTKMAYIDSLFSYLNNLNLQIASNTTEKFGQNLLENNDPVNKTYSLQQVKNSIFKAVNRKGHCKPIQLRKQKSPYSQLRTSRSKKGQYYRNQHKSPQFTALNNRISSPVKKYQYGIEDKQVFINQFTLSHIDNPQYTNRTYFRGDTMKQILHTYNIPENLPGLNYESQIFNEQYLKQRDFNQYQIALRNQFLLLKARQQRQIALEKEAMQIRQINTLKNHHIRKNLQYLTKYETQHLLLKNRNNVSPLRKDIRNNFNYRQNINDKYEQKANMVIPTKRNKIWAQPRENNKSREHLLNQNRQKSKTPATTQRYKYVQ